MSICRAIRLEGTAKGTQCKFPASENGYCGRHQRNKLYDDGVASGTIWCRFFSRGCSNHVSTAGTACTICRDNLRPEKPLCSHKGCTRTAKQDEKYCGKHERDTYRDQEKELGIRYCDITRGCFNICEGGRSSCITCLEKGRSNDNKKYAERKKLNQVIQEVTQYTPTVQICCYCGKDFAPYTTCNNKPSQSCKECNGKQRKQEERRKGRVINYAERRANYAETHYSEYTRSAVKRSLEFHLSLEEFKSIVCQPCFYCGTITAGESIGIDRFDNNKGYILENCRPCCDTCNRMKWIFHPQFFIEKCKILAGNPATSSFFQAWVCYYNCPKPIYSKYKCDAQKRGYEFTLTRNEFNVIIGKPCYLCNYTGITGIDRMNNLNGYTPENCRSCCYSCNMSKADIEYSTFIQAAHMVGATWSDISNVVYPALPTVQSDVPKSPNKAKSIRKHIIIIDKRKAWKAASLYRYLMNSQYEDVLNTLDGVKGTEELKQLREEIADKSEDAAIVRLQAYLLAVRMRRARTQKGQPESVIENNQKGWRVSRLYTYLMASQYAEILDTLGGVENIDELKSQHEKIKHLSQDDAHTILKTYLNTLNVRRSRMKKTAATTDTITHA